MHWSSWDFLLNTRLDIRPSFTVQAIRVSLGEINVSVEVCDLPFDHLIWYFEH